MSNETFKKEELNKVQLLTALIVFGMGIYLITIAPILLDNTVAGIFAKKTAKLNPGDALSIGLLTRFSISAFYVGFEIMIGFGMIIMGFLLYKQKAWAWPFSMLLLSFPTMTNLWLGLPFMEAIKKYPPNYTTFFICVIVFSPLVFLKGNVNKGTMFGILLLIGMIGAQGFMLTPHGFREAWGDPLATIGGDPALSTMRRTSALMFLSFILAALAIYKFCQRKEAGYYLGLGAGILMAVGAFPAHYARPLMASLAPENTLAPSIWTSTYWMAGLQGVILVVWLVALYIRKPNSLVDDMDAKSPL